VPEKRGHSLLTALLNIPTLREHYAQPYQRVNHQRDWIIELAQLLETPDKLGRPRTARQVKREVTEFLERLEQTAREQPDDAQVIAHIVKEVRHRWWGLFTCYRVPNLPSSNNGLETFFKDLKHHQRRITGRKSVHEFVLRYGPFAAFVDHAETFDDLFKRLRQVSHADFVKARAELLKIETRLKKLHRFRHHPDEYYQDLETRWEQAVTVHQAR
jgi:flagellar biosynthesis chaperone FliJ